LQRGLWRLRSASTWDDQDLLLVVQDALSRRELERQNVRLHTLTQAQNQVLEDLNQHLEARVTDRTAELEQVKSMLMAAYEEVNSNFTLAVTVFSSLLEMRHNGIAGQSRRVAGLVKRMAPRLCRDLRSQQDVHLAALLHEIGKIGYPDAMLGKPVSTYSPSELAHHHRHPLDGEAALMPLARLHGVAHIVRQHHERVDGHGFPDGLSGENIDLGARIVKVASDYDGLTSGGLAQRSFPPEQARQALRAGIGSHYDARVVEVLFEVLTEMAGEAVADVEIEAHRLRPGMVLSQDLLSPKGAILLPEGHVFESRVIRQVIDLAQREHFPVVLRILSHSIKSAPALAAGLASGA